MNTKLFAILIEAKENQRIGFFQTFKVLSFSIESAQNLVLMLKELKGKEPKIVEIEELDNKIMKGDSLLINRVLEKTGKALFNLS